jgi:hypothetical protein
LIEVDNLNPLRPPPPPIHLEQRNLQLEQRNRANSVASVESLSSQGGAQFSDDEGQPKRSTVRPSQKHQSTDDLFMQPSMSNVGRITVDQQPFQNQPMMNMPMPQMAPPSSFMLPPQMPQSLNYNPRDVVDTNRIIRFGPGT